MDTIGDLLIQFGSLTGAVWGGTEMVPRAIPAAQRLKKDALALVLGPSFGLGAAALDWAPLPGDPAGWRLYVGGAFAGLLATLVAGLAHDYLVKPVSTGATK